MVYQRGPVSNGAEREVVLRTCHLSRDPELKEKATPCKDTGERSRQTEQHGGNELGMFREGQQVQTVSYSPQYHLICLLSPARGRFTPLPV